MNISLTKGCDFVKKKRFLLIFLGMVPLISIIPVFDYSYNNDSDLRFALLYLFFCLFLLFYFFIQFCKFKEIKYSALFGIFCSLIGFFLLFILWELMNCLCWTD